MYEEFEVDTTEKGMTVVVKNGDVETALRKLKKKVERSEVLDIYQRKLYYLKPCLAKREKRQRKRRNG